MPSYNNSKTQSKNGGRRRKQTKRKLRRGRKSRKVMRGGMERATLDQLGQKLEKFNAKDLFLEAMSLPQINFEEWKKTYSSEKGNSVSLSGILDVMDERPKYSRVKDAINELIAQ